MFVTIGIAVNFKTTNYNKAFLKEFHHAKLSDINPFKFGKK